ncbi:MAG TPA: BON domain-containing protein, partial [Segetibacter sp.]
MKRNTNVLLSGFLVMGMALTACADLDTTIKADLSTKALAEKDFAGVRFTVDNHVVTLSGECPTEKSKSTVEAKAKGLYGVENVVNNITIAPVVI